MKKTVLITAGAKRLGRYIAESLIEDNWSIALHYNTSKIEAEETAHFLSNKGGNVSIFYANFLNPEHIEKLIMQLSKKETCWCGLVNNAGLFKYDRGDNYEYKILEEHIKVNFSMPSLLIKGLFNNLINNKKKKSVFNTVINIIDAKIFGLNPDYYSYTLSKLSLYGLTKMAALSYAPLLRVNGIAPGITFPAPGQTEDDFKKSHRKNLLKRSSSVREVLMALNFLIKSPSITGHISVLDGGSHLSPPKRDVAL